MILFLLGCPQPPDTQAPYDALVARLDALEAENGTLEEKNAELEGRLGAIEQEYLIADDISAMARVITTDETLGVPVPYVTINDALASLDDAVIASGVIVTVEVAAGTYAMTAPITIDHRDADNIHIVGAGSGSTILGFTASNGVQVLNGNSLGLLEGVTFVGDGETYEANGVYVADNAFAEVGPDVVVDNFGGYGFRASWGGVLIADGTTVTGSFGGYMAESGSVVRAVGATVSATTNFGFVASRGSLVHADNGDSRHPDPGAVAPPVPRVSWVEAA